MKEEFEEYIKTLTTAICKDIFLEKLEKLCGEYEKQNENYSRISKLADEKVNILSDEVKNAEGMLNDFEEKSGESFTAINNEFKRIEDYTNQVFMQIEELNDKKHTEFIENLSDYIEKYKQDFSVIMDNEYKKISDKLAEIITPDMLQDFIDELNENIVKLDRENEQYRGKLQIVLKKFYDIQKDVNNKQIEFNNKMSESDRRQREIIEKIRQDNEELSQRIDGGMQLILLCTCIIAVILSYYVAGITGSVIAGVIIIAVSIISPKIRKFIMSLFKNKK